MRISALSRVSGVPVPTIKYYLREDLLPPGVPTARNQAVYDDGHVHRLRLIRALVDVGGLRLADVRRVLEVIADETVPMHELLGVVHRALGPSPAGGGSTEELEQARAVVDRIVAERNWRIVDDAPARAALAQTLVALRRLGRDAGAETLEPYADAADRIAAMELDRVSDGASRAETVERVVVGTVLYEPVIAALRRLAQEHHSAERFLAPDQGGKDPR